MTKPLKRPTAARRSGGFSLIEVLIAIFVLGVGLLGLAGLQASALRTNNQNYERTQAVSLAYELADVLRANRDQAFNGAFTLAAGDEPATPASDCESSVCSQADMAAFELDRWYARLAAELPGGSAAVSCAGACADGVMITISVLWDEYRTGATDSSCPTAADLDGLSQSEIEDTYLSCIQLSLTP